MKVHTICLCFIAVLLLLTGCSKDNNALLSQHWGFLDSSGNEVISSVFESAKPFSCGLAAVKEKKMWWYIDKSGRKILGPFEYAESFNENIAVTIPLCQNDPTIEEQLTECLFQIINTEGEVLYSCRIEVNDIRNGAVKFPHGSVYASGLLNIASVSKNSERMGYIDKKGQWIIAPTYARTLPMYEGFGFAAISCADNIKDKAMTIAQTPKLTNKWVCLDTTGKPVFTVSAEWATWFSEGLAALRVDGKWGFIDKEGSWIIEPQYEFVSCFHNNLAFVSDGHRCAFINRHNVKVINMPLGYCPLKYSSEVLPYSSERIGCDYYGFMDVICEDNLFPVWLQLETYRAGSESQHQPGGQAKRTTKNRFANIVEFHDIYNVISMECIGTRYDYIGNFSEGMAPFMIRRK